MEKYKELMAHSKEELCAMYMAQCEVYDELWQKYLALVEECGRLSASVESIHRTKEESKPVGERKVFYLNRK